MLDETTCFRLLSGISSGIVTLLGSVGIFISLIVQRRIERLQDILEEFMDLSNQEDVNLTGKMFKLIEKYQMHYLMPDTPSRTILTYINVSVAVITVSWLLMIMLNLNAPYYFWDFILLFPVVVGLVLLFFFRHLLKNFISPINKPLLSPIIPPPTKLRSVSYLSRHINVSVKSILKQARLSLVLRIREDKQSQVAEVVLKEELSFDDFFFYLYLSDDRSTYFVSFGELRYIFPPDPITKKPVPIEKNVNIPLGECQLANLATQDLTGQLLIFPKAEKHPIHYVYKFKRENSVFRPVGDPESKINHLITYQINNKQLAIIEDNQKTPYLLALAPNFIFNRRRYFVSEPNQSSAKLQIVEFGKDVFVS